MWDVKLISISFHRAQTSMQTIFGFHIFNEHDECYSWCQVASSFMSLQLILNMSRHHEVPINAKLIIASCGLNE